MLGITVGAAIRSEGPSAEKRRNAGIYVVSSTTNSAARQLMSNEKQSLMLFGCCGMKWQIIGDVKLNSEMKNGGFRSDRCDEFRWVPEAVSTATGRCGR